ncbi:Ubiquinone biosynthesis O-methyltransferase, mitochondrial [subsurface metagenome]
MKLEFKERIERYYEELGDQLGWSSLIKKQVIKEKIVGKDGKDRVEELERYTQLRHKRILDVGSGFGGFIVFANKAGATTLGIEPDQSRIELCKIYLKLNGMRKMLCVGTGEKLPFRDDVFDIVTCHQVLEHTQNPAAIIKEMVRVLKSRGLLYITTPNYLFPYEGHYRIMWIPLCPKKLGKLILRIRRKESSYLYSLNYTTLYSILRVLKEANIKNVRNLTTEKIKNSDVILPKKRRFIAKVFQWLHIPHLASLLAPQVEILAEK